MSASLWQALGELTVQQQLCFAFALLIAFAFEFINGFHDTANAVTTVIYTGTLPPMPAVVYSGFCNFLGVLLGGTAVAFAIVNLLPVDVLIESSTIRSVVMVISLLLAGVIWNLGTWWYGLPVSSSHTLIGSILGVGLANGLLTHRRQWWWNKAVRSWRWLFWPDFADPRVLLRGRFAAVDETDFQSPRSLRAARRRRNSADAWIDVGPCWPRVAASVWPMVPTTVRKEWG